MAHGDYLYLAWAVVPGSRTRFCLGSVEVVGFLRHQGTEQWVSPSSGAAGLGEGVPSKKKKKIHLPLLLRVRGSYLGLTHVCLFRLIAYGPSQTRPFADTSGIIIVPVRRHNGNGQVYTGREAILSIAP